MYKSFIQTPILVVSGVRGLKFSPSLYLLAHFVYARTEGYEDTEWMRWFVLTLILPKTYYLFSG